MLADALMSKMNPIRVLPVRRRLSRYHPGTSFGDDFEWLDDDAIVGYSVSFVEAVEPVEALKLIGAVVDSVPELSAAEADEFAGATGGQSVIRAGQQATVRRRAKTADQPRAGNQPETAQQHPSRAAGARHPGLEVRS